MTIGDREGGRRILIVRPSALGDVCKSVGVLASLARAWPEAQIDWLVQEEFAPAISRHPALHEAIGFARRRIGGELRRGRPGALRRLVAELRSRRYDVVVDCQGLLRSGFFARATGAPLRIGFADAREGAWAFYNRPVRVGADRHVVERMGELARAAGAEPVADLRLYAAPDDTEWAASRLGEGYVVLAPTSRWPGKRWPETRFADLARALAAERRIVIVGGAGEREQVPRLRELVKVDRRMVDLMGETKIGQLMAVVAGADLVVGNDSATVHMAVGFDRPLVALFGPTRVALVGPYRREADVIQHLAPDEPADHKDDAAGRAIMSRIDAEAVIAAAQTRLRRRGGDAER